MTKLILHYVPRADGEPLAMHLCRNADALGMTQGQRRRALEAARLSTGGPVERADAGVMAAALRDELGQALASAIFAAQARGETVADVRNEAGELLDCKRVKGRDGLASLFDSGALTERQWNTGLVYRELYERAGGSVIGSQLGNVDGPVAARSSTSGMVAAGLNRAYAGVRLTAAEAAVGDAVRVAIVRAVAGEGQTIRSMTGGGRRQKEATARLASDLDAVRVIFADMGGLRIAEH